MDISAIVPVERIHEMHHPADEEKLLGIKVELVSIDSPELKTLKKAIKDRGLKLAARGKHFKADEIDENIDVLTFAAMKGWHWYQPDGEDKPASFKGDTAPVFSKAKVLEVFAALPWFRDQIAAEVSETKDFFAN